MKYITFLIVFFSVQANANDDTLVNASKLLIEKLNFESPFIEGIRYSAANQPFSVPEELTDCIVDSVRSKMPGLYAEAAQENKNTASVLLYGELFSTTRGERFLAIAKGEVDIATVSNDELKSFEKYHEHREAVFNNLHILNSKLRNLTLSLQKECGNHIANKT